jgi:hypothetical protein
LPSCSFVETEGGTIDGEPPAACNAEVSIEDIDDSRISQRRGLDLQNTSFPPANRLTVVNEPCSANIFTYFSAEFTYSLEKTLFYLVGEQLTELWNG